MTSDHLRELLLSYAPRDCYADAELRGITTGRHGAWATRVLELDRFISDHGRLPRRTRAGATAAPHELRVFYWMRRQRQREIRLTGFQLRRLELAGLTWEPRERQWDRRLADYRTLTTRLGRRPRRRSADPVERSLALWYQRQIELATRGELTHHRIRALKSDVPRISSRP